MQHWWFARIIIPSSRTICSFIFQMQIDLFFTCIENIPDAWLQSSLLFCKSVSCMFSHTWCSSHYAHSLTVCTRCPLHTQTHTLDCQNCTVHTQGGGKSLAQPSFCLSCKFANTGGRLGDNMTTRPELFFTSWLIDWPVWWNDRGLLLTLDKIRVHITTACCRDFLCVFNDSIILICRTKCLQLWMKSLVSFLKHEDVSASQMEDGVSDILVKHLILLWCRILFFWVKTLMINRKHLKLFSF